MQNMYLNLTNKLISRVHKYQNKTIIYVSSFFASISIPDESIARNIYFDVYRRDIITCRL